MRPQGIIEEMEELGRLQMQWARYMASNNKSHYVPFLEQARKKTQEELLKELGNAIGQP